MSILSNIRKIFCAECFPWATGPGCGDFDHQPTPVERWAIKNASRCSADEIIEAAVSQSISKHFEDWTMNNSSLKRKGHNNGPDDKFVILTNSKTEVDVRIKCLWRRSGSVDKDGIAPWWWSFHSIKSVTVNGVSLSGGRTIYQTWKTMETASIKAKEIADKVKADMAKTEAAWNLAETLLGMKRNEFGALVPVVELCRHGNKMCTDEGCESDCHCE